MTSPYPPPFPCYPPHLPLPFLNGMLHTNGIAWMSPSLCALVNHNHILCSTFWQANFAYTLLLYHYYYYYYDPHMLVVFFYQLTTDWFSFTPLFSNMRSGFGCYTARLCHSSSIIYPSFQPCDQTTHSPSPFYFNPKSLNFAVLSHERSATHIWNTTHSLQKLTPWDDGRTGARRQWQRQCSSWLRV